ncbi:MAG: dTDP-4-dehydrorhamnose reductase [Mycobacteriales bacterium]
MSDSAPVRFRALVTGAGGQVGTELVPLLDDVTALTRGELDITDADAVRDALHTLSFDADGVRTVLFNLAAYTNVDRAESDEDTAYAVNGRAVEQLAAACGETRTTLVHVSTDYVFAGDATSPYEVDAATEPRSVYGRSKLVGERAVVAAGAGHVVRTAWVYGATGGNFVKTIARLERERDTIQVVDDQRGAPTWSADLAAALVELAASDAPFGVYHYTNDGETTWCGFARAVFTELGADPSRVQPCTTAEFPRPAPRPAYSVLSHRAWLAQGLSAPRPWSAALHAAFRAKPDVFRTG